MRDLSTIFNLLFFPFYFLISFFHTFYNGIQKIEWKKSLLGVLFLLFIATSALEATEYGSSGSCYDAGDVTSSSPSQSLTSVKFAYTYVEIREAGTIDSIVVSSAHNYKVSMATSCNGSDLYSEQTNNLHTKSFSPPRSVSVGDRFYFYIAEVGTIETVTITVNFTPVGDPLTAHAGPDRAANVGDTVILDGSASVGSIKSYSWSNGTTTWTGDRPEILTTGWSIGNHTITLTVTDNDDNTDTDTVIITLSTDGGDGGVGSGLFGTSHCGPINTLYEDQCLIQDDLCGIYLQSGNEIIGAVNGELDTPALSGDPDAICRETPGGPEMDCISTGGGVDQIYFDVGKLGGTGVDISTLSNITTHNGDTKIEGTTELSNEILFVNNGKLLLGENSNGILSIDGEVEIHIKPSGGIGDTALILDFGEIAFQTYDSTLKIFSEGAIEIKGPIQIGVANYNYPLKGISLGDLKHPTVNFQILSKGDVIIRDANPLRGLIYTDTIVDIGSSEVYGSLIGSRVYSSSSGPAVTVDASENEGCGVGGIPPYLTGPFDAWDTFRSVSDRNISTKIVSKDFSLTIASINATNDGTETKEDILVKYRLVDMDTNQTLSTLEDFDANLTASITSATFDIDEAHKRVAVQFRMCADYNSTGFTLYEYNNADCTGNAEITCNTCTGNMDKIRYRYIYSSDLFAIRPDRFDLSTNDAHYPGLLRAGQDYNLTVHAYDDASNDSQDYNQTRANITQNLTRYMKDGGPDDGTLFGTLGWTSTNFVITDGISVYGGSNEVAGITYSDVGLINIEFEDSNWAAVDNDDSPQDCNGTNTFGGITGDASNDLEDAYICGDINATFIPHHFSFEELNITNHAGPDSNFTYIANERGMPVSIPDPTRSPMASRIQARIEAHNKDGGITQNFRTEATATPYDTTLYYENNVSITIKVVVPSSGTNQYLYPNADESNVTNSIIGFGRGGTNDNGTRNVLWNEADFPLEFNFPRTYNDAANPFDVNGSYLNIELHSIYTDASTPSSPADINGSRVGDNNATAWTACATDNGCIQQNADANATFMYGRAIPSDDPYDDVNSPVNTPVNTPILVYVYCDPDTITCSDYNLSAADGARTIEYNWWLSLKHNMTTDNYGDIELKVGSVTPSGTATVTTAPSVTIDANAKDENVFVAATSTNRTMTVNIDLVVSDTASFFTHRWLIYNPDSNTVPSPFYRVLFIGRNDWAGHGDTGHVVDSNISSKKNRRLGW